jgi:hypothetical protein
MPSQEAQLPVFEDNSDLTLINQARDGPFTIKTSFEGKN